MLILNQQILAKNNNEVICMRRGYTIWDEFERMQEEMDRLFSSAMGTPILGSNNLLSGPAKKLAKSGARTPVTDMWETKNEVMAQVELPGVNKDDIDIDVDDKGIRISVEKEDKKQDEDMEKGYYSCERSYSGYYRYFPLPENTDKENIDASYKDGVLELKIPKREVDKKETKKIEVK